MKDSQAEEVAALQEALERERSGRRRDIRDLKMKHSNEKQQLVAEHAQKVRDRVGWRRGVLETEEEGFRERKDSVCEREGGEREKRQCV